MDIFSLTGIWIGLGLMYVGFSRARHHIPNR